MTVIVYIKVFLCKGSKTFLLGLFCTQVSPISVITSCMCRCTRSSRNISNRLIDLGCILNNIVSDVCSTSVIICNLCTFGSSCNGYSQGSREATISIDGKLSSINSFATCTNRSKLLSVIATDDNSSICQVDEGVLSRTIRNSEDNSTCTTSQLSGNNVTLTRTDKNTQCLQIRNRCQVSIQRLCVGNTVVGQGRRKFCTSNTTLRVNSNSGVQCFSTRVGRIVVRQCRDQRQISV